MNKRHKIYNFNVKEDIKKINNESLPVLKKKKFITKAV